MSSILAVKALADVLEAVVGAVYVDSNFSLDAVTGVISKLGLLDNIENFRLDR